MTVQSSKFFPHCISRTVYAWCTQGEHPWTDRIVLNFMCFADSLRVASSQDKYKSMKDMHLSFMVSHGDILFGFGLKQIILHRRFSIASLTSTYPPSSFFWFSCPYLFEDMKAQESTSRSQKPCRPWESGRGHSSGTNAVEERKYTLQNATSYFISL